MRKAKLIVLIFTLFFYSCNGSGPKRNDVTIRASHDPENLNPVNFSNTLSLEIINLLYQSLLTADPENKQIVPLLAESLPAIKKLDSQCVFSYKIKDNAKWDNQQAISSADVAFSLKVLRCPLVKNQQLAARYYFIKDIVADKTDPGKFELICNNYTPEMDLMTGDFAILPEYLVDPKGLLKSFSIRDLTEKYDSLSNDPHIKEFAAWFNSDRFTRNKDFLKGSGGYELVSWKTGQYVGLRKKQNWWGEQVVNTRTYLTAQPEKITFQVIPDNATALLALKNQQLDVYAGIPVREYKQLAEDKNFTRQYNLYTPETYDFTYLGINGRLAKFADVRTRQALAHLLDVDKIIKATQSGFATRTVGPIIPADTRFYNNNLQARIFEPGKAQALLKEAGWVQKENFWQKQIKGRWVPLTINLNYKAGNTEFENIALIFQQAAAAINIPVTIQPLEGLLLTNNLKAHQFELFIRYLSGNPFVFNFKSILHSESAAPGGGNYTGFGTPESDQLIDQVNQTQDVHQKTAYLKRFQEILHEQGNLIFLYFSKDRIAVNNRFTNLKISGIKPGYNVSAFTLKTQ